MARTNDAVELNSDYPSEKAMNQLVAAQAALSDWLTPDPYVDYLQALSRIGRRWN